MGAAPRPQRGGLGGRTPQKLGLSNQISSNTKSLEYRLYIRTGKRQEGEYIISF
ncbi:unknown protein [Microcystis aeruginosa NIES-843]|uniref:Uncharacterized protein n=1 Tax=Microcystis aeruginosa (strain NIES-843 / IAM M-2473) TaxID=449447 RepID=B0JY11_MICAN|nr:unknown protein [Microcystis aeruginosa NIES-843]